MKSTYAQALVRAQHRQSHHDPEGAVKSECEQRPTFPLLTRLTAQPSATACAHQAVFLAVTVVGDRTPQEGLAVGRRPRCEPACKSSVPIDTPRATSRLGRTTGKPADCSGSITRFEISAAVPARAPASRVLAQNNDLRRELFSKYGCIVLSQPILLPRVHHRRPP